MPIITISRGSYSRGKEIAERLSDKLGYDCISRDIIIEASEEYNVPEVKLVNALSNSPSFLDRITYGKERYINFIQQAFLHQVKKDNVIYHGMAGHFFLKDIPGVLKVRIIAKMEDRIKEVMKRERISEKESSHFITKIDENRRKWSQYLFGINTENPGLYDLVVNIDTISVDHAVQTIADVSRYPCFQATTESLARLEDMYLASRAEATLKKQYPYVSVDCRDEKLVVNCKSSMKIEEKDERKIAEILSDMNIERPIEFVYKTAYRPD